MKYIIINVYVENTLIMPIPFIFPNSLVHKSVYKAAMDSCKEHFPEAKKFKVKSAGFINIDVLKAFGSSESLGVNSMFDDTTVIKGIDYHQFLKG